MRFAQPLVAAGVALVIAAGVAVWATTSSSSDRAGTDDELFGVASSPALSSADLNKMQAASVRSVRFFLGWPVAEPDRGSFDWDAADRIVGGLASHGIHPVPFVFGSPSWVAEKATQPPISSPAQRAAWTAFLKAAVDRYGPDGSFWDGDYQRHFGSDAEPVPITAWQIWNEPNLPHYFTAASPAAAYSQLVGLSHDAITAQDPSADIVLAGMPGYGKPDTAWKFLGELYRQPGFARSFEAVALHPYARTVTQLQQEISKLRAVMADEGDGTTPLWLTEIGWGSGKPNRFGLNKGIDGQEKLLEKAFQLIIDRRDTWHVQRLFWYQWRDPPPNAPHPCSFCSSAGLLKHDGFAKPSWVAYREFASGQRQ